MKTVSMLLAMWVFVACGHESDDGDDSSTKQDDAVTSNSEISFKGYVLNAFEVTVDGHPYGDLEDFFTKELARLPEKAKKAGFDESYTVSLDAEIGFKDLWFNMDVYVSPTAKEGYQGMSKVGTDGKFSVALPPEAIDDIYRVRAIKRIRVNATKDDETQSICFNFSAVEKSVEFSAGVKPIVLDAFSTDLTSYECANSNTGGLDLPDNTNVTPSDSTAESGVKPLLRKGMTKAEVIDSLGRQDLSIESSTKWCWAPAAGSQLDPVCAVNYASACRCSVTFDEDGKLIDQENVKGELIDALNW